MQTLYITYALGSEWIEKIATTEWKVGENTSENIIQLNASMAYQNEIANPKELAIYSAKIGLMYVSDYYYGASPEYWWDSGLNYIYATRDNWMYMGLSEWTITKSSDKNFGIFDNGSVANLLLYVHNVPVDGESINIGIESWFVRPTFYLNSNVKFSGGSGTSADPYRLSIA